MIATDNVQAFDTGLELLSEFAAQTGARGRFISLYLALRRMGPAMAPLGSETQTSAGQLEQFLDHMFTKTHRPEPFVVLTAPFGQSTSPNAPYSTPTGQLAPGNKYPTNTWRNNFGIQKGIGCPAEPGVINALLDSPMVRLACPHMAVDAEGRHVCGIQGTNYRGEEHSIWLRLSGDGYQVVDLDRPPVYSAYLHPSGVAIPIFPLIAVLYCAAPVDVYPTRQNVGIPDFAEDFHFSLDQVQALFDCDPDSIANAALLAAAEAAPLVAAGPKLTGPAEETEGGEEIPFPELGPAVELNSGVGAELAVAAELQAAGWVVTYRGNQRSFGYDLEARRDSQCLRVEVKSSVGFVQPELTESEWSAGQNYDEEYILAVVDFYGSDKQIIWYVRNPAANIFPVERQVTVYRLPRADLFSYGTEPDFL